MRFKIILISLLATLSCYAVDQIETTPVVIPAGNYVGPLYKCESQYTFATLGNDRTVLNIYSSDFQILKTISFPGYRIYPLEDYGGMAYNGSALTHIMATQHLFNDDDLFEVLVEWIGSEYEDYPIHVFNENGEDLGIVPTDSFRIWNDTLFFYNGSGYDDPTYLWTFDQSHNKGSVIIPNQQTTLSIYGNPEYVLDLYYVIGARAKVEIKPQDGWDIYSVIFNDEDVTDELEENVYQTEPLGEENILEIIMVESNAGVKRLTADNQDKIIVSKVAGGVSVSNVYPNENLEVYDLNGIRVYNGTDVFIPLDQKGMYILKSEKATIKFAY